MKKLIPQNLKNCYHLAQAISANVIYGFPSKKITVIGVTGTNGKTTTCQMIAKILEGSGAKVAMASTINFKLGEKEWVNKTKLTTLSSLSIQKFIRDAVNAGCKYLVLETSSHALDQNRVWGVKYKTAVITNVTREHLDYHGTMDEYRIAKLKLFCCAQVGIINLEMEKPKDYLLYSIKEKYGYTKKEIDCSQYDCGKIITVKADDIRSDLNGSEFSVNGQGYKLDLPGDFNVENALAAISVGMSEHVPPETMSRALEKIKVVPGRMDKVLNDRGIDIVIDYALTPDSMEKLYKMISEERGNGNKKIISVFGSCGDRDRGKRPMMGEVVDKYADYIIVTNEDPYGENPVQIINEVFSGVVGHEIKGELPNFQFPISNFQTNPNDQISNDQEVHKRIEGVNCWRILDRREAIRQALNLAKTGDIVLITGKGAEETMMIGHKMVPWNDKKVIMEELGKLGK